MFIVSNEKIYLPGKNQEYEELRKDFSSVSLFRFELAKRKSTGAVTGFFRFISASLKDIPAEAVVSAIYDVTLENGLLRFMEDQALYRDHPTKDGGHRPVAFIAEHRLFVENEKLHYEYNGKCLDVDAGTLYRKESGDHYPSFVSVEQ
jgi:urease beta subunit